jgi:hypothetical protein
VPSFFKVNLILSLLIRLLIRAVTVFVCLASSLVAAEALVMITAGDDDDGQ